MTIWVALALGVGIAIGMKLTEACIQATVGFCYGVISAYILSKHRKDPQAFACPDCKLTAPCACIGCKVCNDMIPKEPKP